MIDPVRSSVSELLDAQLLQKVLPKLNGSRRRLEGLLLSLATYCIASRNWDESSATMINKQEIADQARQARLEDRLSGASRTRVTEVDAYLPRSLLKINRMLRRLEDDGFVSFAEA